MAREAVSDRVRRFLLPRRGIFIRNKYLKKDITSLGLGEPDFPRSHLLGQSRAGYTSNQGIIELREKVAFYLGACYGFNYDSQGQFLIMEKRQKPFMLPPQA